MDRYNGSCKFSVWLCQIAKHLYFDYLKKQKHRSTLDIEQTQKIQTKHAIYDIEEDFIRVEEIQMLLRVVDTTKEPYRKILLLRLFDELSYKEIGKIFGKSENWARVTYYRAKEMIKERMVNNENNV